MTRYPRLPTLSRTHRFHTRMLPLFVALLAPFHGAAAPLGGEAIEGTQWYHSTWYGHYHTIDATWVYHIEHAWQYVPNGSGENAAWVWDHRLESWIWVDQASYPWIYADVPADWLLYSSSYRRETDPRWFRRSADNHWITDTGEDLDERIAHAWTFAGKQLRRTLEEFSIEDDRYPYETDAAGNWKRNRDQTFWTAGYFPACMWYLYRRTGDESWRDLAIEWTLPIEENTNTDIAVRYFYSYGRGYQYTGDTGFLDKVIYAVDLMTEEWWVDSLQSFQSWERDWSRTNHAVVTDVAIHMQPFFAASRSTGNPRYDEVARGELDSILELNVREDGSTLHFTDLHNNGRIRGVNNTNAYQGYHGDRANSVWSRAQAWAVMAFPMAYRYTAEPRYLEAAEHLANYFLENLPEDHVPPSSFRPLLANDVKDSSASAIAAVGLKELAGFTGDTRYANAYRNILLALTTEYLAEGTPFKSILHRGSHHTGAPEIGTIYGDCFFLEALLAYESEEVYAILPVDQQ